MTSPEIDWRGREPLPLRAGSHPDGRAACLREMIYYLATGRVEDAAPPCASRVLCALAPALTDSTAWESDAERERVLLPYATRLLDTAAPLDVEIARARALADEAGLIARELRDVVGERAARAEAEAVAAAARAAAEVWAARAAAEAVRAAKWAARAAAEAVRAAKWAEWAEAGDPRFTIAALSVRLLERGLAGTGGAS